MCEEHKRNGSREDIEKKVQRSEGRRKEVCVWLRENDENSIKTSTITNSLTSLAEKCGIYRHVTAHSARKGAAAEAMLAEIPLVVVKAMGHWSQVDTLEKYIGESIRRQVGLLPILAGLFTDLIGFVRVRKLENKLFSIFKIEKRENQHFKLCYCAFYFVLISCETKNKY